MMVNDTLIRQIMHCTDRQNIMTVQIINKILFFSKMPLYTRTRVGKSGTVCEKYMHPNSQFRAPFASIQFNEIKEKRLNK